MHTDLLIVGQGLAGTMLAWACERAGISFAIADRGHARAATMAAAGIINPITGRRLVKTWMGESLLPLARSTYREMEAALGIPLWREMRVQRLFADEAERRAFEGKFARGELAPFAAAADENGFWIEGAARVDLAGLLTAARARWKAGGRLLETEMDVAAEAERHALVIDCTGLAAARDSANAKVAPWEFSKGEVIEIALEGLEPDVVINRRHWVLPVTSGTAWVGATHEPGVSDSLPTPTARAALESSARLMLARAFATSGHRAGVRVNLPDRRPLAGLHAANPRIGFMNGLGAKGALLAPMLAQAWVEHVLRGKGFAAEVDVARFASRVS